MWTKRNDGGKKVEGRTFSYKIQNSGLNLTTSFSEHLVNLKSKYNLLNAYCLKTTILGTTEESQGKTQFLLFKRLQLSTYVQPDSQRSVAFTWERSSELLYPMIHSDAFGKLCDRNGSLTWLEVLVFSLSQIPGKCVDIPHCESL